MNERRAFARALILVGMMLLSISLGGIMAYLATTLVTYDPPDECQFFTSEDGSRIILSSPDEECTLDLEISFDEDEGWKAQPDR
jgi:hypothetical protein